MISLPGLAEVSDDPEWTHARVGSETRILSLQVTKLESRQTHIIPKQIFWY